MDLVTAVDGEMDSKATVRSCTTCSKAKAKCVRQSGQEVCERCARLRKECYSREAVVRRRKGVVKTSRAAQLEKLEHKIEGLVNALANSHASRTYGVDAGQPSPVSQISERTNQQQEVLSALCIDLATTDSEPSASVAATGSSSTSMYGGSQMTTPSSALTSGYPLPELSLPEMERALDRYRRLLAHNVPFVVVSSSMSVQQMYSEKPVLLQAIVTVTHFHDFPRQQILVRRLIREITERVMIKGEKSLEVLQAILILISWFHPHIWTIPQATNFLHLAQALIVDLNLDKAPQACDLKHPPKPSHPPPRQHATMDEMRAYTGTFFLISMLFTAFKKIMPMRRSKYLDEVLTTLEMAHEYDTDLVLVQMTRLQFLADDASSIEPSSAPIEMYVKSFRSDLDKLREHDPCKMIDNQFLPLQYLAVEILIWELSLNDLQDNGARPLRSHLDNLCRCADAIKAFLNLFFTIPATHYLTLSFSYFGQFAHALIGLIKLASLDVEGWSMKDISQHLNFSELVEEIAVRYENGSKYGPDGLTLNNESFVKWASRVRWMKKTFEAKFTPETESAAAETGIEASWSRPPASTYDQPTPAQQQPTPPDDMLSGDFFNYIDDSFWQSFAGDGLDLGFSDMAMT